MAALITSRHRIL